MPKLEKAVMPVAKLLRKPCLSDIIPCTLLFLAARCSVFGISPFAAAMFASVFDLSIGLPGLAAVILGLVSAGVAAEGAKYVSAILLFWMYALLRPEKTENSALSAFIISAFLFLCGVITLTYTGFTNYKLILLGAECIVCAFLYMLFEKAGLLFTYSRRPPTEKELISGAVCVGIFISGLSDIIIPPGLNAAKILTCYAIMTAAMNLSVPASVSFGTAAGFICNMSNTSVITISGLYGISAVFSRLLRGFGKYGAALGFMTGCAAALLLSGNTVDIPAFETVAAAILFIITPNRLHSNASVFISRTARTDFIRPDVKMREYLSYRLADASNAFLRLASVYKNATQKRINMYNKDICTVIDATVNRVCRHCPCYGSCMQNGYADSFRIIFGILEIMEHSGFCTVANAPADFMHMCKRQELFLCEFSHSYELFKRNALKQGEFINNRDLMLRQYEEIAELFARFHDEITTGFRLLPDAEEKIAAELLKSGVTPSDVRAFETADGEIEVFVGINKQHNGKFLAEKISGATGMVMESRGKINGGLMRFCPASVYEAEFGMMQVAKDNRSVSGDSITSFRQGNDKYYVILCDGMGSGAQAGKESRITAVLLEELLRDGFSAKTAIETVNSSLAMGVEQECFSSVDLLAINLITGNAEFYKTGSCKSFIKRKNGIETVFSPSLPVGILPEVHISCISKRLEDGDTVIMLSDGAEGNSFGFLSGEKIKKILADEDKTMDDIAASIINNARGRGTNVKDDMTAAVIKIHSRGHRD